MTGFELGTSVTTRANWATTAANFWLSSPPPPKCEDGLFVVHHILNRSIRSTEAKSSATSVTRFGHFLKVLCCKVSAKIGPNIWLNTYWGYYEKPNFQVKTASSTFWQLLEYFVIFYSNIWSHCLRQKLIIECQIVRTGNNLQRTCRFRHSRDSKVAFTLVRFTQHVSSFHYIINIFAHLERNNLLRKQTRENAA